MKLDAIVVGAGPAGTVAALLAARAGLSVALIERKAFPRDKVCGEFVSAEGVAVLRRLGLDLGASPTIANVRISDSSGRRVASPLPHAGIGLTRSRMDLLLLDAAREAGATVLQPWRVLEPIVEGGRVVGLRAGDGRREHRLQAAVVVAADGRRSAIARALGLPGGDPSRTDRRSWFGLKCHLEAVPEALADHVELHLFGAGYVGLSQVEAGRANLCLMARASALQDAGKLPERVVEGARHENVALDRALGAATVDGRWHAVGPLRFGVREPASHGVLFAGDAAGTIDPFSGEGISNALVAGELLQPFLLQAVADGVLSDASADAYREAWLDRFAAVTRRNRRLGRLFGAPRASAFALRLLRGPARRALPRLVAATRTGTP